MPADHEINFTIIIILPAAVKSSEEAKSVGKKMPKVLGQLLCTQEPLITVKVLEC